MQHGLRERFQYFECTECGCLQIAEFPPSLERYYPLDYYSLKAPSVGRRALNEFKLLAAALGLEAAIEVCGGPRRPLQQAFIPRDLPRNARVLDIGAGNGGDLRRLYRSGYRRVHGIDPNLDPKQTRRFPFRLERATSELLLQRGERYAFVYLSHSLEHVPEQRRALEVARGLLEPGGTCCVRIPWLSCDAWERYGMDWVQLDAPRHFYLHSRRSFELLCAQARLRIARLWCDSTAFQFWGSEQYKLDIPLYSERSWLVAPERSPFSAEQIADYERQAAELNACERGDQIVAWLVAT